MCVREPHVPLHVLTLSSLQSWDTELEAFAQAYAEKCIWDHNKERGRRGENLFAMAPMLELEFAVEDWNAEEKCYNLTTSTCVSGQMCGQYTQVPTCWGRGEVWWGFHLFILNVAKQLFFMNAILFFLEINISIELCYG